jgi:hypothetical protein
MQGAGVFTAAGRKEKEHQESARRQPSSHISIQSFHVCPSATVVLIN